MGGQADICWWGGFPETLTYDSTPALNWHLGNHFCACGYHRVSRIVLMHTHKRDSGILSEGVVRSIHYNIIHCMPLGG